MNPNSFQNPNNPMNPNSLQNPNNPMNPNSLQNPNNPMNPNSLQNPNNPMNPNSLQNPNNPMNPNSLQNPNNPMNPNSLQNPNNPMNPNSPLNPNNPMNPNNLRNSNSLAVPASAPAPPAVAAPGSVAEPAPANRPAGEMSAPRPKLKPKPKHHIVVENSDEVEPAQALVKLKENTWVYSRPNKWSHNVGQVHMDKFINVTGSTHYYLRVKLKNGKVGYITPEMVELVRPMDRTFFLTSDSPVYDRPNRWGRKLSEVHKNHAVHVVGIALEYMKIRMKDGLEGFIPRVAME